MELRALWIFFLLLCFDLAFGSRIVIDPKSCTAPNPNDPSFGIANIQVALNEAFTMAQTTRRVLKEAAAAPFLSPTQMRVDSIMEKILAAGISSPFYARVQRKDEV